MECGCGGCPADTDPLYDGEGIVAFPSLKFTVLDSCSNPRPMTLDRARKVYLKYQRADMNADGRTSLLADTRDQYARFMSAESELLDRYDGSVTTALLSRRLSPIHDLDGRRQWVPPTHLDDRLSASWGGVREALRYHLDGYDYEYCWARSFTDTCATPHEHIMVWIDDPDDTVTVDDVRPAVESHVRNTEGAYPDDHPVEPDQSDAATVRHDPIRLLPNPDTVATVQRYQGDDEPENTTGFAYIMNQRPHWVLKNLYDGTSDVHADSAAVDGGTVAWASTNKTIGSSNGFPT